MPKINIGGCAAAIGSGAAYPVGLATGDPVRDLHSSDQESNSQADMNKRTGLTDSDRCRPLVTLGIQPVASVFLKTGDATALIGRKTSEEFEIDELTIPAYWHEHTSSGQQLFVVNLFLPKDKMHV